MSTVYKSNYKNVLSTYKTNISNALLKSAREILPKIIDETPERSGALKKGNKWRKETFDSITFFNTVVYAKYVELGTYLQFANPFFRRALLNSLGLVKKIFYEEMKL